MNKLAEEAFLEEICRRLDGSIAHLSPSINERLDVSRQCALQQRSAEQAASLDSLTLEVRSKLNENDSVSPEIEDRLNQIRQLAIAQLDSSKPLAPHWLKRVKNWLDSSFSDFNLPVPAGMLATACVLVTVVSIFYVNSRPAGSVSLEEEISLIASAQDIELYENLEFYLWLVENESINL